MKGDYLLQDINKNFMVSFDCIKNIVTEMKKTAYIRKL